MINITYSMRFAAQLITMLFWIGEAAQTFSPAFLVTAVHGTVLYKTPPDTAVTMLKRGDNLPTPSQIKTYSESHLECRFGNAAVIRLDENSNARLGEVKQSSIDGNLALGITLDSGEVEFSSFADSSKKLITISIAQSRLTIQSASLIARAHGDIAEIDLSSGNVSIEGMRGKAPLVITAPKRITINQRNHTTQISALPSRIMLGSVAIAVEIKPPQSQKPAVPQAPLTIAQKPQLPDQTKAQPLEKKVTSPHYDENGVLKTIALVAIRSQSVERQNCDAITEFLGNEIAKTQQYHTLFPDEIASILRRKNQGDLGTCNADSCLIESGMALGADYLLTGDIGKLGSQYVLNLKMINVLYDRVDGRISEVAQNDPGLFFSVIPTAIHNLFTCIPRAQAKIAAAATPTLGNGLHASSSDSSEILISNQIGSMVALPKGTFYMGSAEKEGSPDEQPQHSVTVAAFALDKYEVTQIDFGKTMGFTPSSGPVCGPCPVNNVTWNEAYDYCTRIDKRLPTEAEWEYACRANAYTYFSNGNFIAPSEANFNGEQPFGDVAPGLYRQRTTPVGSFNPNAFGLYDMQGNVLEWCNDWYDPGYYARSPVVNPKGPQTGFYKVLRGGGFSSSGNALRSAKRVGYNPTIRLGAIGFRCAADSVK